MYAVHTHFQAPLNSYVRNGWPLCGNYRETCEKTQIWPGQKLAFSLDYHLVSGGSHLTGSFSVVSENDKTSCVNKGGWVSSKSPSLAQADEEVVRKDIDKTRFKR